METAYITDAVVRVVQIVWSYNGTATICIQSSFSEAQALWLAQISKCLGKVVVVFFALYRFSLVNILQASERKSTYNPTCIYG